MATRDKHTRYVKLNKLISRCPECGSMQTVCYVSKKYDQHKIIYCMSCKYKIEDVDADEKWDYGSFKRFDKPQKGIYFGIKHIYEGCEICDTCGTETVKRYKVPYYDLGYKVCIKCGKIT